jgi:hypothetical protein
MAEAGDVKTLEQRVRMIEDRLEIYNLIASHPPSADTASPSTTSLGARPSASCTFAPVPICGGPPD